MLNRNGGKFNYMPNPPQPIETSDNDLKARVSHLPTNFDWRNVEGRNFVSPVRDQESCGSCYIFCSLGAIEARLRIISNMEREDIFSVQVNL